MIFDEVSCGTVLCTLGFHRLELSLKYGQILELTIALVFTSIDFFKHWQFSQHEGLYLMKTYASHHSVCMPVSFHINHMVI